MAVIFHIDINSFFASAHVLDMPQLKGKPVAVGVNKRGAVITTASYEARAFGVNSAMPLSHARKLCPQLEVVSLDMNLYKRLSLQFIEIIKRYSPFVQQASIDECYVDLTHTIKKYQRPLDLAIEIQEVVLKELMLPISIGVAPNKFLAKMASDMQKPNGITVLRRREVSLKLWPLSIDEMHGIGKKTVPRLKEQGIHTIGDLAQANPGFLLPILGQQTELFIDKANGIDLSPIIMNAEAKSLGQSKTFHNAMYDLDEIRSSIKKEIVEMTRRLELQNLSGRTLTFAIRMDNYKSATRSVTLDHYTRDTDDIFERVMMIYEEFDGVAGVVFVSVSMSNLQKQEDIIRQLNIFEESPGLSTYDIISKLNQTFKGGNFMTPRDLLKKKHD